MKNEVFDAACDDRLVDYIIRRLLDCEDDVIIDNSDWLDEQDNFKVYDLSGELLLSIEDGYINDMPNDYYVESPTALEKLTLLLYNL